MVLSSKLLSHIYKRCKIISFRKIFDNEFIYGIIVNKTLVPRFRIFTGITKKTAHDCH